MTVRPSPPLSLETIRAHLTSRIIGSTIVLYDEVDSTNRLLADLAKTGASDGTVVVAEFQTAGRGRLGRRWISPHGMNLYASILLPRTQTPPVISWIPLMTGIAVVHAIKLLTGLHLTVKWPNDVLAPRGGEERKLAGILVEAIGNGPSETRGVVVGIGINVNMPSEAFPEDLRASATSLLIETGHPIERAPLLAALMGEMERLYEQLREHGTIGIAAAYEPLCATLGKHVRIELAGSGQVEGTAEGLASDGALRLRTREGKTLEIRAGDVVHLR